MHITCEHFDGKYPSFNVNLHSKEGTQPFLTIKGVRVMNGHNGEFVSWPATKSEKTGKYWQHVFGVDAFNLAVIEASKKGDKRTHAERKSPPKDDLLDVPF